MHIAKLQTVTLFRPIRSLQCSCLLLKNTFCTKCKSIQLVSFTQAKHFTRVTLILSCEHFSQVGFWHKI